MPSTSSGPSIVKSVRQRQLLNAWLRLSARHGRLPRVADYEIDRIHEEKQDMVFCAVTYDGAIPRYMITYDGQRLVEAFGETGVGRRLEDALGPERAVATLPIYNECVARGRPSYSIRRVVDVRGREVDYERLLLPFGNDGCVVDTIVGSLKTISADGSFEQKRLMRAETAPVSHAIQAIIDKGDPPRAAGAITDAIVEL